MFGNSKNTVGLYDGDMWTERQNDKVTEWQSDKVTEWQSDKMTEWQNDKIKEWQKKNSRMYKWEDFSKFFSEKISLNPNSTSLHLRKQ